MFDICIIGAGVTGLSLLLLLKEAGVSPSRIAIIDPHFDGGDLARRWTSVPSNTPWSKTFQTLRELCPSTPISSSNDPDVSTPLIEVAELIRMAAASTLRTTRQVQGQATQAAFSNLTHTWTVKVSTGSMTPGFIEAKVLILAVGAEPRSLDLPIPSIPLEIALDPLRLKRYVHPGQRVIVFGTMHSGTLVIRNAAMDCSGVVTALYNSEQPFYWARDGAYDGIKREAADVADAILAKQIHAELVSTKDVAAVIRASATADWVVYAMGFMARELPLPFQVDGIERSGRPYDGHTGALTELPAAWGFGTAYPNRAPDGMHWDVSVAAFLVHMKGQLPAILQLIPSSLNTNMIP